MNVFLRTSRVRRSNRGGDDDDDDDSDFRRRSRTLILPNLDNPGQQAVEVAPGEYQAAIGAFLSRKLLVGPVEVSVPSSTALFVYAVGSLKRGTFQLLIQTLPIG